MREGREGARQSAPNAVIVAICRHTATSCAWIIHWIICASNETRTLGPYQIRGRTRKLPIRGRAKSLFLCAYLIADTMTHAFYGLMDGGAPHSSQSNHETVASRLLRVPPTRVFERP